MKKMYRRSNDDELREYKKALKMAKRGIEKLCELTEEMEEQFEEDDEMAEGEQNMNRRSGYRKRDDWDEMDERRGRSRKW